MSALVITQYTDSCARSLISSIPIWLLCNCFSICLCNRKGSIILLLFIAMPSIITNWLLIDQYCFMLCSTSSLLCAQPCIIYVFVFYWWVSSCVTTYMSSMDVHSDILIDVLMIFIFMFIPVISWSLFSEWVFRAASLWCISLGQVYMYVHPVLVYPYHYVLQPLRQSGHICNE